MSKITIGTLAELAGVGVETIRFYQRKQLLRIPKSEGAIRLYLKEDVQKIIFIKRAQGLGFTLKEVKELLELNTKSRGTCFSVKTKTEAKIIEIQTKISDLEKMKEGLEKLACACDGNLDSVRKFKVQECFDYGLNCNC